MDRIQKCIFSLSLVIVVILTSAQGIKAAAVASQDPFAYDPFALPQDPYSATATPTAPAAPAMPSQAEEDALAELFKLLGEAPPPLPSAPAAPSKATPLPGKTPLQAPHKKQKFTDPLDIFLNAFSAERKKETAQEQKTVSSWMVPAKEPKLKIDALEREAYITCKKRLLKPLNTIEANILTLGISAPDHLKPLTTNNHSLQTSLNTIDGKKHFYYRYLFVKDHKQPIGARIVEAVRKLESLNIEKKLAFTQGSGEELDLEARSALSVFERKKLVDTLIALNRDVIDPLARALETFVKNPTVTKAAEDRAKLRADATKQQEQKRKWTNHFTGLNSFAPSRYDRGGAGYGGRNNAYGRGGRVRGGYDPYYGWGDSNYFNPYGDHYQEPFHEAGSTPNHGSDESKRSGGFNLGDKTVPEKQQLLETQLGTLEQDQAVKNVVALSNVPLFDPRLAQAITDGSVEKVAELISNLEATIAQTPLTTTPAEKTIGRRSLAPAKTQVDATLQPLLKNYYDTLKKLAPAIAALHETVVWKPFHQAHKTLNGNPLLPLGKTMTHAQGNAITQLSKLMGTISIKGDESNKTTPLKTAYDAALTAWEKKIAAFEEKREKDLVAELGKLLTQRNDIATNITAAFRDSHLAPADPEAPLNVKKLTDDLTSKVKPIFATISQSLKKWFKELLWEKPTSLTARLFKADSPVMQALDDLCRENPATRDFAADALELIPGADADNHNAATLVAWYTNLKLLHDEAGAVIPQVQTLIREAAKDRENIEDTGQARVRGRNLEEITGAQNELIRLQHALTQLQAHPLPAFPPDEAAVNQLNAHHQQIDPALRTIENAFGGFRDAADDEAQRHWLNEPAHRHLEPLEYTRIFADAVHRGFEDLRPAIEGDEPAPLAFTPEVLAAAQHLNNAYAVLTAYTPDRVSMFFERIKDAWTVSPEFVQPEPAAQAPALEFPLELMP